MMHVRASVTLRLALILGAMAMSALASVGAFAPAQATRPVLVLAAPWSGGAAARVVQAGGREISPMRAPFAVLAVFDSPDDMAGIQAWAVWDAMALARLCGIETTEYGSTGNV